MAASAVTIRPMELKGTRIAALVDDLYDELELWHPVLRFREEGAEVALIGAEAGHVYRSALGYPVRSDLAYGSALPREFDALLIPGGFAPDHMRRHTKANQFVCEMDWDGKLIASIGRGGWVLCSAGVLKGRRATCYASIKDDLIHAGAEYEDAEVVIDGNLVTSRGADDLPAFCRAALRSLNASTRTFSASVAS